MAERRKMDDATRKLQRAMMKIDKPFDLSDTEKIDLDFTPYDEIYSRADEGPAVWDAKADEARARGQTQFPIHFIVGCTKREASSVASKDSKLKLLITYFDYPKPNWEDAAGDKVNGNAFQEFEQSLIAGDMIELRLIERYGEEMYKKLYPYRYLKYERGEGNGGYVTMKRSLYINRLKAFQWKLNQILMKYDLPLIFVEDWAHLDEDDASLKMMEFICRLLPDDAVSELLEEYQLAGDIKCSGGQCKGCFHSHNSRMKHTCCGLQQNVCYDEDGKASLKPPKTNEERAMRAKEGNTQYECTSECHADAAAKERCKNMYLQRGRTQTIVLFRDAEKGWTIRCTKQMKSNEYFSNYAGEVHLKPSTDQDALRYDFGMAYGLKKTDGTLLPPFIICAYHKGNETRWVSHSCEPNLEIVMTVVERYGRHYANPTMYSSRAILPGEELTFDYFVGNENADVTHMFDYCRCGSKICRYTKKIMAKKAAEEVQEEKEEEEEEGEEEETSSEEDGDEIIDVEGVEEENAEMERDENSDDDAKDETAEDTHEPPKKKSRV